MNLFACNHWFLFIRAQVTGIIALIRLEFALLHPIYQFLRNGNLWLTPKKKRKKTEQQYQNSTQRVNRFNYADSNMMLSVITLPLLQQAKSQKFLFFFFSKQILENLSQ